MRRLTSLAVYRCMKVRQVFHYDDRIMLEEDGDPPASAVQLLPQLEDISLLRLGELTSIWEGTVPRGTQILQNVRRLRDLCCNSLEYLLAPAVLPARAFEQLQSLTIDDCDQMEKIIMSSSGTGHDQVGRPSSSTMISYSAPSYAATTFFNSKLLCVCYCQNLTSLFLWRQAVQGL